MADRDEEEKASQRKFPVRRKLPHEPPHWVGVDAVYFVTVNCTPAGRPQLCSGPDGGRKAGAVIDAARFYHEKNKWFVRLFLAMPDHVHALLSFPSEKGMKATMTAWKRYLCRFHKVNWQDDFFDHRIRDEKSYSEKYAYVVNNPVRKGLCERVTDWSHVVGFDPRSGEEIGFN